MELLIYIGDKQVQALHTLKKSKQIWDQLKTLYEHTDPGLGRETNNRNHLINNTFLGMGP